MDQNVVLPDFKPVLEIVEEIIEEVVDQREQTDRAYWEKKSDQASIFMTDKIIASLQTKSFQPVVTYNRHHMAVRTTGYNFCWLRPRKTAGLCHMEVKLDKESRQNAIGDLQSRGIDASLHRTENIVFSIRTKDFENNGPTIMDLVRQAEEMSKS